MARTTHYGSTYETNPAQEQFKRDMQRAGRTIEWYEGRSFYYGWAVRATDQEDAQTLARQTSVRTQRDNMGHGFILYPTHACILI